jgi:TetR/AcrR family transcriptional regulator, repressor for neighboring sulfatase
VTTEGAITPVGRDEVVAATLEAAADLFADRGPAATSIRDVAARAGVNHGLIHRHFGTKEQLVGAVLDHLARQLTTAPDVDAAVTRQMRVIARATLDGYSVGRLQTGFPTAGHLVDDLRRTHSTEQDARLAAAHVIALQLGWKMFGEFLRASTGLDGVDGDTLQRSIWEAADRLGTPARD